MNLIRNGWFSETNDLWPGQCLSLEVDAILHEETSKYQHIMVLQTKSHGRALILDGIIQCTEHDEFAYQEMISFLPLCAHADPKTVLIVGGGDGGVAREVAKHPRVQKITQVEIDDAVVETSKKYLPFMSSGFASPKLDLQICDGFEYMRQHRNEYDVIITDSSDPIGPAVNLFTDDYFQLLKNALRPNGLICSQAGTIWNNLPHVKETLRHCKKHFATARFALASVPTYPTGQIGFVIGASDENADLQTPKIKFSQRELEEMNLRYYSAEIHSSSFVLPNFALELYK